MEHFLPGLQGGRLFRLSSLRRPFASFHGFLRCVLSTALFSLLFALCSLAATAQISFTDPTVTVGAEVNVSMKVKSEDGALSRANIDLVYDPNVLEFLSGTDADGGAGRIKVHGGSVGGGTGVLSYNLRFQTLTAGNGSISIETQEVYDIDEALASISHLGNSSIRIVTDAVPSNVASLGMLEVSPGELMPAFSPDITQYEITVGTDVNSLDIQAAPVIETAQYVIEGNSALDMGESLVRIRVTAADGVSVMDYEIKVQKVEGGPAAGTQGGGIQNEGVRLSSKDKSITIMNPSEDVEIPEGFQESPIEIDHHQVRGWVWREDNDPKYCIVYGMNQAGELYFYRYDLEEKTIQRYFADPVALDVKQRSDDYAGMIERYDALVSRYNTQFILSCVLGGSTVLLLALVLFLLLRRRGSRKGEAAKKPAGKEDAAPDHAGSAGTGDAPGQGGMDVRAEDVPVHTEPDTETEDTPSDQGMETGPEAFAEAPRARSNRRDIEEEDIEELGGDTRTIVSLKRKTAEKAGTVEKPAPQPEKPASALEKEDALDIEDLSMEDTAVRLEGIPQGKADGQYRSSAEDLEIEEL